MVLGVASSSAAASSSATDRPAASALGKRSRPGSENDVPSLNMSRSPVGPSVGLASSARVGSSAGAASSSGPIPISSIYGRGCISASYQNIQDIHSTNHVVFVIEREIGTTHGPQFQTEHYTAEPTRRPAPGSAEEQQGNLVHKYVSDGIAVFGDRYAVDDGETSPESWHADPRHMFLRCGMVLDDKSNSPKGVKVAYLEERIAVPDNDQPIVVKRIITSQPSLIYTFWQWLKQNPEKAKLEFTATGYIESKRVAVKRFFSETTPEQRVAKLPLDLGLNNSVFAPRGDLDQPLPENQAGSSRAHRTQSAFTAEFLGLNEDHIEQDSLRPRAQSEFPPDLEAYLMSSVDDQSVLPIFTAESVFSSVAEEDRVMKEANNEATNEIEEIEEIEAWLEQFSE